MNVIEFSNLVTRSPGIDPLTPGWAATLRLVYGLPLTDADVAFLETATGRSHGAIATSAGQPFGELWARVGRRGRKSSTIALVTAYEALYGGHSAYTMPGELAIIATISKDLSGAELVRRFQHLYLDALGIKHTETRFGSVAITLIDGTTTALACLTCTSEAPRGPAIPVAVCDEIAFWSTSDNYAEPDKQILAALRPAMLQFPNRKLFGISSPLAKEGEHYKTVEAALGNDDERRILAVQGPTWVWDPGVSEAETRELERDPKVWAREYAAIPQDAATAAFEADLIEAAFGPDPKGKLCEPLLCLDPSGGHGDAFCWATVQWCQCDDGRPILFVNQLEEVEGKFYGIVSFDTIVASAAKRAKADGAEIAVSDSHQELGLQSQFGKRGIRYVRLPWSNENKVAAVARLRRLLAEKAILFHPSDDKLKKELYGFQEKILPSGAFTYGARRAGHDDRVAVVLTALIAEQHGLLSGSPLRSHRDASAAVAMRGPQDSMGNPGRLITRSVGGDSDDECVEVNGEMVPLNTFEYAGWKGEAAYRYFLMMNK